jgi:hypothetical protein
MVGQVIERSAGWRIVTPSDLLLVVVTIAGSSIIAESIGSVSIPAGVTSVALFPFLWALLICVAASIAMKYFMITGHAYIRPQTLASDFVQIGILLFIAKLGFIVGTNVAKIIEAGPVLLLQELGNFFGTVLLALPIALLLGIKREAVGATFSVGREPGVAIIADRYGMNSAEGRGVLAEYVTGSVIGAAFIAILASLVAQTGIFSPTALGMAAGIGSGSMTAAAVGALSTHFPASKDQIAALAAASNLITTVVGTYILVVFSLPISNWLYAKLEPILSRNHRTIIIENEANIAAALGEMHRGANLPSWSVALAVLLTAGIALAGNYIATKAATAEALVGMIVIVACVGLGLGLAAVTATWKIPALIWVSLAAAVVALPISPVSAILIPYVAKVGLLPLVTPVLAYAGLSLAKDFPVLKALGWRIVVVSLLANAGAFLAGAIIAQAFGA